MKKYLFMAVLFVAAMFTATSCGSDDDDNASENNLVGSVWECAKGSDLYTFEFNSSTSCKLTKQEKEWVMDWGWNNVTSYVYYTYTLSGNTVTLKDESSSLDMPLLKGTISGSTMSIVNTSTNSVIYTCTKIK